MRRIAFLAGLAAVPLVARAQEEYDPAVSAQAPALRVLLGQAPASAIDAQTFLYDGRR
jgi:hypothetical protein